MDLTDFSQQLYPGDHVMQNFGHSIIEDETCTATERGTRGIFSRDEQEERNNAGQDPEDPSAQATSLFDGMQMSYLWDDNAENMPCGNYESWKSADEPYLVEAEAETEAADGDSDLASRQARADEKIRAILRARQRAGRPGGLSVAVDGEDVDAGAMTAVDWGDVRVLDCSDEMWEQIIGEGVDDGFAIWEDGPTMGEQQETEVVNN
ncbi:hypothetical protein E4U55_005675 [Claviceps digitariae]|nr:hypothetical protein E4U55_005675 [Claviceps digitariae]